MYNSFTFMARKLLAERCEKMLTIRVPVSWHASLKTYCADNSTSITKEMKKVLVEVCKRNNIKLT